MGCWYPDGMLQLGSFITAIRQNRRIYEELKDRCRLVEDHLANQSPISGSPVMVLIYFRNNLNILRNLNNEKRPKNT